MSTTLYILIPLITGVICWILGYLIGNTNANGGDGTNHASLKADLAACKANSKNLSKKVTELEHEIYELTHSKETEKSVMNSAAPIVESAAKSSSKPAVSDHSSFDANKAKEAMGKKIKLDDLKLVEGIGPKIAEHFNNAGITTWQKLGDASVEDCQKILTDAGDRFTMHNPGTWPRQAKLMAEGKWTELKAWTETLDGGKE